MTECPVKLSQPPPPRAFRDPSDHCRKAMSITVFARHAHSGLRLRSSSHCVVATTHSSRFSTNLKSLYMLITTASLALRVRTTIFAVLSLRASSRSIPGFLTSATETLYAPILPSPLSAGTSSGPACPSSEPASVSKIVAIAPIAIAMMSFRLLPS